ncbi:MAG TPA: ribonuclease Z [Anaerolineae bacterium]|nr:ribonuclease Z [Anaerolineae bacterium]HQM15149.1 ribonuclease Z [Anaerolineae bacterium]
MIELVFLGTAASAPSIQRGLPSQMILYKGERFLVDCGEGTQRQILRSGLGFRRLERVFLTHGHLDHILGLGGLISTFARWEAVEHIEIWGGRWTLERVNDLLFRVVLRGARPPVPIEMVEVRPGALLEWEMLEVSAFPVTHRGPGCFGYLFREQSRRPFLPERAEALGVPAGPERRRLVNGEAVTLADGRTILPDEVLGLERPGIAVAVTGDAARVDDLVDAVCGVDVLVCEATYLQQDVEMAQRFGHLLAAQAAWLAREADVRLLVLSHLSQRYRVGQILDEVRPIFPEVVVARDFDHFQITRERIELRYEELAEDDTLLPESAATGNVA